MPARQTIANAGRRTAENAAPPIDATSRKGPGLQIPTDFSAHMSMTQDAGMDDPGIEAIGERLKDIMAQAHAIMAPSPSLSTDIPCIGQTSHAEIANILRTMRFHVTNSDFGPGRAGENIIDPANSTVVVHVNAASLKGYDVLTGGLAYLVAHEVAHALIAMQAYDKRLWQSYITGTGAGLPVTRQSAEYPRSAEFAQNEARANTIARALTEMWDLPPLSVGPQHGYQSCS